MIRACAAGLIKPGHPWTLPRLSRLR
jgi:hypothetical protein